MAEQLSPDKEPKTISFRHDADESNPNSMTDVKKALSGFFAARVELASLEAKEVAGFAAKKLVYLALLAISGFFLWCLLLAGLTGVLAPFANEWLDGRIAWLPGWCAVLFGLALIHALVAVICAMLLKKKPHEEFFALSRQELQNDKQWLGKKK